MPVGCVRGNRDGDLCLLFLGLQRQNGRPRRFGEAGVGRGEMRPRDRSVYHGPAHPWAPACSWTWSFPGAQPHLSFIGTKAGRPHRLHISYPAPSSSSVAARSRWVDLLQFPIASLCSPDKASPRLTRSPWPPFPTGWPHRHLPVPPARPGAAGPGWPLGKDRPEAQPDLWDTQT